ncbi:MAG: TspO/MBR family protein [Pseudomonadota bacterium]
MSWPAALRQRSLAIALAIAFATATIGGALTEIGPWYRGLEKPWFQPPDWAFGPAWTLIYLLTATAAHLSWQHVTRTRRAWVLILFLGNAALNAGWSLTFFWLQRPDLAVWESCALWASILALMIVFGKAHRAVIPLLMPYLLWVSFATYLNQAIVELNAPFV